MLEPARFEVNDAWILFQLNEAPVCTQADGDFNVLCLMDAASCYILGYEFVPDRSAGVPEFAAMRLIEAGRSQARTLPGKFLLSVELEPREFTDVAQQFGVEVSRVPEDGLAPFTSEARELFQTHFGGGEV